MSYLSSYQLIIKLDEPICIRVGKLGEFEFKAGFYVYSGSAKTNADARIRRHCRKEKKLRWHIDYLTTHPSAQIIEVKRWDLDECLLNQQVKGKIVVRGFGSSDCKNGCGSHLKLRDE